eukprot:scaffold345_cov134-Cylindrotheca_fusiformis.AAC.86
MKLPRARLRLQLPQSSRNRRIRNLRIGMQVVSVNGTDVDGFTRNKAIQFVRGAVGELTVVAQPVAGVAVRCRIQGIEGSEVWHDPSDAVSISRSAVMSINNVAVENLTSHQTVVVLKEAEGRLTVIGQPHVDKLEVKSASNPPPGVAHGGIWGRTNMSDERDAYRLGNRLSDAVGNIWVMSHVKLSFLRVKLTLHQSRHLDCSYSLVIVFISSALYDVLKKHFIVGSASLLRVGYRIIDIMSSLIASGMTLGLRNLGVGNLTTTMYDITGVKIPSHFISERDHNMYVYVALLFWKTSSTWWHKQTQHGGMKNPLATWWQVRRFTKSRLKSCMMLVQSSSPVLVYFCLFIPTLHQNACIAHLLLYEIYPEVCTGFSSEESGRSFNDIGTPNG